MGIELESAPANSATPGASNAQPSAAPHPGRGLGYAQGRAAVAPGGSALLAGASQTTEEASNNGLTAGLLRNLRRSPGANLDDAVSAARGQVAEQHHDQHASVAVVGSAASRAQGKGKKHAVFMANARYADSATFPALDATVREAQGLEASLASRGYASRGVHTNKTAAQMKQQAATAALGTSAAAGDHVVIHYGGHGLTSGLVGVNLDGQVRLRQDAMTEAAIPGDTDQALKPAAASLQGRAPKPGLDPNDVLAYSTLDAIAQSAVAKGLHVSLILDACHSGNIADLARTRRDLSPGGEQTETTSAATNDAIGAPPASSAAMLTGTKLALVGIVRAWEADCMAARQEGRDGRAARVAEVDARYLAALQQLWQEFIAARLATAEADLKARAQYLGPAPTMPTQMGLLGDVLAWLDRSADSLSAPSR